MRQEIQKYKDNADAYFATSQIARSHDTTAENFFLLGMFDSLSQSEQARKNEEGYVEHED